MSFTIVILILAASVVFFATGAACFVFALLALKGGETYEPDRLVAVELEDRSDQETWS